MEFKNNYTTIEAVAEMIWDICKLSPQHGIAVQDLIGDQAFISVAQVVSRIEAKREKED